MKEELNSIEAKELPITLLMEKLEQRFDCYIATIDKRIVSELRAEIRARESTISKAMIFTNTDMIFLSATPAYTIPMNIINFVETLCMLEPSIKEVNDKITMERLETIRKTLILKCVVQLEKIKGLLPALPDHVNNSLEKIKQYIKNN